MKKIITTIILNGIFFTVFAQQTFQSIHYYTGGAKPNLLDYGVFNTGKQRDAVKPRALTGTIIISMADSTIRITDNGIAKDELKIKAVQAEVTDRDGNRSLSFVANDAKYGFAATVTILRDQVNAAKNEMKFVIKYHDGSGPTYDCAFIDNLFKN